MLSVPTRSSRQTPVSLMRVGVLACAGLVTLLAVAIVALVLSAGRFSSAAERASHADRLVGVGALLGALLLLIAAAVAVRRGMLVPLRRLQAAAERFSRGDLSARLDGPAPREFEPVTAAFNQMADRLAERGQRLT